MNQRPPEKGGHGTEPGLQVCSPSLRGSGASGQDRLTQTSYTYGVASARPARPARPSLLVCWQTVFGLRGKTRP